MRFASPAWLLLLIPVAALLGGYVIVQLRRQRFVARFTNVELLASVAPKRPGWRRHLTFALLLAGLAVLTVATAEPTAAVRVPRDRATVMVAIDVSLSMKATDVLPDRISAAKTAAKSFVDLLPPRINVGLVKFGGNASVVVPPTIDRDTLKVAIDNNLQLQDSTAIGEAVFTCLDAISVFAKNTTSQGDTPPPARIVLMSDGANNKGRRPDQAAAAAKQARVSVSTIAFGTDNGTVDIPGYGPQPVPADKPTLRDLAEATGGTFNVAASAEALQSVYRNIGQQIGYTTTRKVISWRFLATGLLLALTAAATSMLWAGRIV
jgi:Ca-activated chloride channel family protein